MTPVAIRAVTYRFLLRFSRPDGTFVHELPLHDEVFTRAREATFLAAFRQGHFDRYELPPAGSRCIPRFIESDQGSPRTTGFEVVFDLPQGGKFRGSFDTGYFRTQAQHIRADLIRRQVIPDSLNVHFRLEASIDEEHAGESRKGIEFDAPTSSVPIVSRVLEKAEERVAWDNPTAEDLRVLVPRNVLEDALDDARRLADREVAGLVLGHLCRCPRTAETYLLATCYIPAEGTQSSSTSVTLTGPTWASAREVARVRGTGEIFAGWVHSHPFLLCKECPLIPPPECVDKILFYSLDDEFLMEQMFAQPFMVGLLTALDGKLEAALGHLPVRMFGWRRGEVVRRGFEVVAAI